MDSAERMRTSAMADDKVYIRSVEARDIRFPTSFQGMEGDAQVHDPDYSCAYVVLNTNIKGLQYGYGISSTMGRGTEIVVKAIKSMAQFVVGIEVGAIVKDLAAFSRLMTHDGQMRWLGPEKGVVQLAASAIINAVWDLHAKREKKPLWKLMVDMEPEELVHIINFDYIKDALTKEEALMILKEMAITKKEREEDALRNGFPVYESVNEWLCNRDEESLKKILNELIETHGTRAFKFRMSRNLDDDMRSLTLVRSIIGPDRKLMLGAHQAWGISDAISNMKVLADFHPTWIEEPTASDDIVGHAEIAEALKPLCIGVAAGKNSHNRVMFKQLFQSEAVQFCQIDPCRLGGINEVIAVMLMAKKFGVTVCPYVSGFGGCELAQHLALFNYIAVSGDRQRSMCEYDSHLQQHFHHQPIVKNGVFQPPKGIGSGAEMKNASVIKHEYPHGSAWKDLFQHGVYANPVKYATPVIIRLQARKLA